MRGLKLLAAAGVVALLVGCKTTVEAEVRLSDLVSGPTKTLPGSLFVEVSACQDYQDSRQPSSSLIEVRGMVPQIFKDAEFIECYRQQFNSYARFNLPLVLDKDKDGKLASENHINILSNETNLLALSVPPSIKAGLDNAAKRGPGSSLDMNVVLKVQNDTGKDFSFSVLSAFIDDEPHVFGNLTSKAGTTFSVKLSDVSVQSALGGDAMVLLWAK